MNKDAILKHTVNYKDGLLGKLQDPEFAKIYLETALESYQEDGSVEALLLAMRDVAEAQGGIGELAKKITISREHLYDTLSGKHTPRLDNWLKIISALGFRVRLEPQEKTSEHVLTHKS